MRKIVENLFTKFVEQENAKKEIETCLQKYQKIPNEIFNENQPAVPVSGKTFQMKTSTLSPTVFFISRVCVCVCVACGSIFPVASCEANRIEIDRPVPTHQP